MKEFSVVVAVDASLGIGKAGDLPWHLPGDLAWFKQLTSTPPQPGQTNTVIMGRKTWESIPMRYRPLKGRFNIVMTRAADYVVPEGTGTAQTLDMAVEAAKDGHIFCVGGGEIYRLALEMQNCTRIYITRIHKSYGCDTFFPEPGSGFLHTKTISENNENDTDYSIELLERVKA